MTAGREKSAKQLVWEPPRVMRLTAPGDAQAADCEGSASSASGSCTSSGNGADTNCSPTGNSPLA